MGGEASDANNPNPTPSALTMDAGSIDDVWYTPGEGWTYAELDGNSVTYYYDYNSDYIIDGASTQGQYVTTYTNSDGQQMVAPNLFE